MAVVRDLLNWLPWSVTLTVLTFVTWVVSGWRLAAFTFFAILYMPIIGYWGESMNSLALVAVSVPAAVGIGFGLGTLAFFSRRAERAIAPVLDPDADRTRLRLPAADPAAVRLRTRGGPDREHPLCLSADGAEHASRALARTGGGDRGRTDGRRHPEPALLARACTQRPAPDPARREPDHHGRVLDGDHRLDHRRQPPTSGGRSSRRCARRSSARACWPAS